MKWLVSAAALLALGIALRMGHLLVAMYGLAGLLLAGRLLARRWDEGLEAERDVRLLGRGEGCLPPSLEVGDQLRISLTLRNRGFLGVPWALFEDSLPVGDPAVLRVRGRSLGMIRLGPRQARTHAYRLEFRRRGYYPLGPMLVETGDLFGMHRHFRLAGVPRYVTVLPRVVPLEDARIASRRHMGDIPVARNLFQDPTRVAGVRPYQPGDPFHHIHWKATARTGTIHSRVFEHSSASGATFLLDFAPSAMKEGEATELAVTTVASFARALLADGQPAGLLSNGRDAAERHHREGWAGSFTTHPGEGRSGRSAVLSRPGSGGASATPGPSPGSAPAPVHFPARSGEERFVPLLELLARLEKDGTLPLDGLLRHHAHLLARRCAVVPVLAEVARGTALALGMLKERGFSVTVILVSPGAAPHPDWARPPAWAQPLLGEGIDFLVVQGLEHLQELSLGDLFARAGPRPVPH